MEDVSSASSTATTNSPTTASQWRETLYNRALQAKDLEERITVAELFYTALDREPGDTALWKLSVDWTYILFKAYHKIPDVYNSCIFGDEDVQPNGEEDAVIGTSVLQWDRVLVAWKQAADAVKFHINDSNIIWDPYFELLLYDLTTSPSPEKVAAVNKTFVDRLHQPQSTWDNTFQAYSQFISQHDEPNYEQLMLDIRSKTITARKIYEDRESYERALAKAVREQDSTTELQTLRAYLVLEEDQTQRKKKTSFANELFIALCERATSRFPDELDLWQDYVIFLLQKPLQPGPLLSVTQRATAHCPTSGLLWQYRIYAAEALHKSHDDVHLIKNEATFSGTLVDQGKFEEQIKVDYAWCSFLRRRAFRPGATSDDRDICEMAIRSAIDEMMAEGKRMHGSAFAGDPEFRLERIYLRFWAQSGKLDAGRKLFKELEATYGHLAHFWERWYLWEMTVYSTPFDLGIQADFEPLNTPSNATAVYERALKRAPLNTYDQCMELVKKYLHHCGQHETVYKLLEAIVTSRRYSKKAGQMLQEYYAQVEAQNTVTEHQATVATSLREHESGSKRKRDDTDHDQPMTDVSKRHHHEPEEQDEARAAGSPSNQVARATRDRENSTIMVHHLPPSATEESVRRFFRECGPIVTVNVSIGDEQDLEEKTALVEFGTNEDVLAAKTKDKKVFEGREIDVQLGVNTTLFVTNYPPKIDEKWIRELFEPYGTIVQVRFPSLKYSAGRRFCYVQFHTEAEAHAATQLDNKHLSGNLKLVARISNPAIKNKVKTGPAYERRELYVANINWKINEDEFKQIFTRFGNVQSARIPRRIDGGSKGFGFIVFETAGQASEALAMNNREDRGRILQVSLSDPLATGARRKKGSAIVHGDAAREGESSTHQSLGRPARRTLTLLNVADTVNADRIDALCAEFGEIVRVKLRPSHAGATVEYTETAAVRRAKTALSGRVLDGLELEFGTLRDLIDNAPIEKSSGPGASNTNAQATGSSRQDVIPMHRGRGASRIGSNIGLHKRATGNRGGHADNEDGGNDSGSSSKPKTQDDFRAMLLGKKVETKATDATVDTPMEDANGSEGA